MISIKRYMHILYVLCLFTSVPVFGMEEGVSLAPMKYKKWDEISTKIQHDKPTVSFGSKYNWQSLPYELQYEILDMAGALKYGCYSNNSKAIHNTDYFRTTGAIARNPHDESIIAGINFTDGNRIDIYQNDKKIKTMTQKEVVRALAYNPHVRNELMACSVYGHRDTSLSLIDTDTGAIKRVIFLELSNDSNLVINSIAFNPRVAGEIACVFVGYSKCYGTIVNIMQGNRIHLTTVKQLTSYKDTVCLAYDMHQEGRLFVGQKTGLHVWNTVTGNIQSIGQDNYSGIREIRCSPGASGEIIVTDKDHHRSIKWYNVLLPIRNFNFVVDGHEYQKRVDLLKAMHMMNSVPRCSSEHPYKASPEEYACFLLLHVCFRDENYKKIVIRKKTNEEIMQGLVGQKIVPVLQKIAQQQSDTQAVLAAMVESNRQLMKCMEMMMARQNVNNN